MVRAGVQYLYDDQPGCPPGSARGCGEQLRELRNNNLPDQTYIQTNVVNPILSASHLDPGQVQNFTVTTNVILNPGSPQVELGTVVSLQYPYNFKLNGVSCCPPTLTPITTGIVMTAQAQARQED